LVEFNGLIAIKPWK